MKQRFYWLSYENELKTFIETKCQFLKNEKPNRTEKAPLLNIKSTQPFELIAIGCLQLDECKGQYKYLMVVVGQFSKYAQAFLTKNKSGRAAILFNRS